MVGLKVRIKGSLPFPMEAIGFLDGQWIEGPNLYWTQQVCRRYSPWFTWSKPEPYKGACGICGQPKEAH